MAKFKALTGSEVKGLNTFSLTGQHVIGLQYTLTVVQIYNNENT